MNNEIRERLRAVILENLPMQRPPPGPVENSNEVIDELIAEGLVIDDYGMIRRKRFVSLLFRVDTYCSGGWQHTASFAGDADAYEYGERYASNGARVWNGEDCIAVTYGPRSWHAPRHNRDCNGKPCECGAVPLLGSMARAERKRK